VRESDPLLDEHDGDAKAADPFDEVDGGAGPVGGQLRLRSGHPGGCFG
jgi:hypothetical protein